MLSRKLKLCGKEVGRNSHKIECKDAMTKQDSNSRMNDEKTRKIFIGGLPHDITQGSFVLYPEQLESYFGKYGEIVACKIICKHDSKVSRGFGFVIYQSQEAAEHVIADRDHHYINGKWVDCKSAILRQEMYSPVDNLNSVQESQEKQDSPQRPGCLGRNLPE